MANKKRPRFPAPKPKETEDAYLARVNVLARETYRLSQETVQTGRPSMAALIMYLAHIAMLRWTEKSTDPPSQQQIQDATMDLLTEICRMEKVEGWVAPSANTIRKHVQCFLRWRRGMTDEELGRLPKDQRTALSGELFPGMEAAALIGQIGATEGIVVQGDEAIHATIAVTRQIKAIKTLR